ncbi:MAG: CRISPR system precrRNA processing endoribonuclease RAMP protein Cas6 [Calditrichia bacterium]
MKIRNFDLHIEFEQTVNFSLPPTFYFRSLLGKELKNLVCLYKGKRIPCDQCTMKNICSYAQVFETPIDKDNPYLEGRTHAPHPFVLYTDALAGKDYKSINLNILLLGNALAYMPVIILGIVQGGKNGIFREKIKYNIKDIISEDESIFINEETIIPPEGIDFMEYPFNLTPGSCSIRIEFVTPFRFKKQGKYVSQGLTYEDVLLASKRRVELMLGLYGNNGTYPALDLTKIPSKNTASHLVWENWDRYSRRQNTAMSLGGLIGVMDVTGEFTDTEVFYLKGASLLHIGKNAAFGLGKILIKTITEE